MWKKSLHERKYLNGSNLSDRGTSKVLIKTSAKKIDKENNSKALENQSEVKILTENSKTPLSRALALASFLGTDYPPNLGARTAPPAKDLMAFGSVLAHNQHNIGKVNHQPPTSSLALLKPQPKRHSATARKKFKPFAQPVLANILACPSVKLTFKVANKRAGFNLITA